MTQSPPPDINPDTGSRLPPPDRDDLDEAGRAAYDRYADFRDGALMGLKGPSALTLHSPGVSRHFGPLTNYLRFEAEFSPAMRELIILLAAREMDSGFEWAAHEAESLDAGLPQDTMEAVKFDKPVDGLPDDHALIIRFARQVMRQHQVPPEMYKELEASFGPGGVVDLAYLFGAYVSLAIFLATIDAQVPDGNEAVLPVG